MESLNKMNDLIAAISIISGDNAELQSRMKDGKDTITKKVREVAAQCYADGQAPLEAFADWSGLVTRATALDPDLKINKIYGTGIKGFVTMLQAGVNIEVYTDKGKPASIQEAVGYIASDDVKRINAAKARIAKVVKGCSDKNKKLEAANLEALADMLEELTQGDTQAQAVNG